MIRFSSRTCFHTHPNRLTGALRSARASGRPLLDLTESNPTRAGLASDASTLLSLLESPHIARYEPEPFGLDVARHAVADALATGGTKVRPQNVLLTSSTSEAYSYLLRLLCDPGDAILVPSPSYPLLDVLAQLEDVRLVRYPLAYDGEWHIDLPALRAACDARTRAVVTVHPNNPTGSFLKRDELRALASLGLPIISDEVFAEYALTPDPRRAESVLEAADEALVFRLGGLSKSCALPQLKLAWTVIGGPGAEEARARLEHVADAYLSPGAQVQLALPRLLEAGAATRAAILERLSTNLATLTNAVVDSPLGVLRVEGGWYAILRMPALLDDEGWALSLLNGDGVVVQPGYYYELHAGAHIVISLLTEEQALSRGVARIVARARALAG